MPRRRILLAAACNPCAAKKNPCNPCAAKKNPCNPCAAKNPCNPCAAAKACNPCNPCAAKNPCNPCAAKNPCNPCAAAKACNPCNPCAAKNPCNPCGAGKLAATAFMRPSGLSASYTSNAALIEEGKRLWNDTSLSSNGLACGTCHKDMAALNKSFSQPYPHEVAMPSQMAGVGSIHADEMVQFCMVQPMQSKPLHWNSKSLAALTAYTLELQKSFNPCAAAKNPCNPCNPCAAKKNPCNPCNPCAAKKTSS